MGKFSWKMGSCSSPIACRVFDWGAACEHAAPPLAPEAAASGAVAPLQAAEAADGEAVAPPAAALKLDEAVAGEAVAPPAAALNLDDPATAPNTAAALAQIAAVRAAVQALGQKGPGIGSVLCFFYFFYLPMKIYAFH